MTEENYLSGDLQKTGKKTEFLQIYLVDIIEEFKADPFGDFGRVCFIFSKRSSSGYRTGLDIQDMHMKADATVG